MSRAALIRLATDRAEAAISNWRRLTEQCHDARQKLLLLRNHQDGYRNAMRAQLRQGMPAAASAAYFDFIAQIETVIARQRRELGDLEAACARGWEELLQARRDKRMYEILAQRVTDRTAEIGARRRQAEADERIQRRALAAARQSIKLDKHGDQADG